MSDCTGCRNTQVSFQLTEILWDHKFMSDVTKLRGVSDCTRSTAYGNILTGCCLHQVTSISAIFMMTKISSVFRVIVCTLIHFAHPFF